MLKLSKSKEVDIDLRICCLIGLVVLVEHVWPSFLPRLEGPANVSAVSFWKESEMSTQH